jgi:hypothetical protein
VSLGEALHGLGLRRRVVPAELERSELVLDLGSRARPDVPERGELGEHLSVGGDFRTLGPGGRAGDELAQPGAEALDDLRVPGGEIVQLVRVRAQVEELRIDLVDVLPLPFPDEAQDRGPEGGEEFDRLPVARELRVAGAARQQGPAWASSRGDRPRRSRIVGVMSTVRTRGETTCPRGTPFAPQKISGTRMVLS